MSVVKRGEGQYAVVVETRAAARRCTTITNPAKPGGRQGHVVWLDEHQGDECPKCGAPLGPIGDERRPKWHSGFKTLPAAKKADARLSVNVQDGTYVASSDVTLREYLQERWLPKMETRWRPSTMVSAKSRIDRHIIPTLGATRLRDLRTEQLNVFYRELLDHGRVRGERGLTKRTVAHTHKLLHRALHDAVQEGLLMRNPAAFAAVPTPEHREMKCWTREQLRTFIETEPDDRLSALWQLVATTGMRRGELCGLRWADVDLDAARLSVTQTITAAGYELVTGAPKTKKSRRVLALDPGIVAALKRHRTHQMAERLAAGEAWADTGLVFTREDGNGLHPQTMTYLFVLRAKSAGLPAIRLHDVRHSYATAGLEAGVHPKVMQERLGHSSIAITLDVYSHVTEGVARDEAERLAGLILASDRS